MTGIGAGGSEALGEFKIKMSLIGDPAVGKSSLVSRFVINKYSEKYLRTLGTNVYKKKVEVEVDGDPYNATLMVWDVLGQDKFQKTIHAALEGTKGALLVCDITNSESIRNLGSWVETACNAAGCPIPIILVANKSDLIDQCDIDLGHLRDIAEEFSIPAYLTSAKTGAYVEDAFHSLAQDIIAEGLQLRKACFIELDRFKDRCAKIAGPKKPEPATPSDHTYEQLVLVEDRMITMFCDAMGGQEEGMSFVRLLFKRHNVDFTAPKYYELVILMDELSGIVSIVQGKEQGEALLEEMQKLFEYFRVEEE